MTGAASDRGRPGGGTTAPRLAPAVPARGPATLDEAQQRVVDHPGGPLLVLAGPGTGKTATLVEAVADRIGTRGADPSSVLALTFSRKAAEQLRDRVSARLGRTTATPLAQTFHSFALQLVRRYAPASIYDAPLRLLSAPEQDVVLRELLADSPEAVRWPESLRHAVGTRGFAHEVATVLSRAREKGLTAEGLRRLGEQEGLPEYVAAGSFLEEYLTNLDHQHALDYADLVRRATLLAEEHRAELRAELGPVFVDELQDTDPGQLALLQVLAGDGRDLVAVGDPHQSIYAFRGAEVRGILDFPDTFRRVDQAPADVVSLATTRRFGPRLLTAAQHVAGRLSLPGTIPAQARAAFLHPVTADGVPDGRVEVRTFDTERAEAEHLADLLRRAHLNDGVAWGDMAVLVRSGRQSLGPLRRSLGAAGVPVEVAADEVPLVRDAAVRPLLEALRAVLHLHVTDPADPDHVDPRRAEELLLGPLGGLDAGDLRRLQRALWHRAQQQAAAGEQTAGAEQAEADGDAGRGAPARGPAPPGSLPSSAELVREAVVTPGFTDGLDGPEVDQVRRLHGLLTRARSVLDAGGAPEEVLWELWSGTPWPGRLRRQAEAGGPGSRRAHRDLDAVCALFDAAARVEEQRDHTGVANFLAALEAQEIPADTLAEQGVRGDAVRLLTAHRAKGLEWRLVVVAHVQQDRWPDLRRRSSLLQADRIGHDGLVPPVPASQLLLEERRLFYVACTRAREWLVVTAVSSQEEDGEQPSRFLEEVGAQVRHTVGRPVRPLSLDGLVAELRRTVADPASSPALREAAARRLARLSRAEQDGVALVPRADPATWWGTRAPSRASVPVRDPAQPVPVSASVLEKVTTCPAQWFLTREAGGVTPAHQSAGVGNLVHALAERVGSGDADVGPEDVDTLMAHVDRVWGRLAFRTPWSAQREYARVRTALQRFLVWHAENPRTVRGTEERFATDVTLDDGERVRLSGTADRLEVDADGRVVVVDLKTGRSRPSGPQVAEHRQLALYQYAVDAGAVDHHVTAPPARSGGAELVQLGLEDGTERAQVQQQEAPDPEGPGRGELRGELAWVATMLRTEEFPARPGPHCQWCDFQAICPARGAGSVIA